MYVDNLVQSITPRSPTWSSPHQSKTVSTIVEEHFNLPDGHHFCVIARRPQPPPSPRRQWPQVRAAHCHSVSKTPHKLIYLLPSGVGIHLPTLSPTERRLVATTAQGACAFEPIPPLVIAWPRKTMMVANGEPERELPVDVGWSRGIPWLCDPG